MLPQIQAATVSNNAISEIIIQSEPSLTYNDRIDKIVGKTTGTNSIIQAVRHMLHKERYAYPIYPDWYGMELEKYQGQSFEYLQAQIANDLSDCLLQDDRIYQVEVTDVVKVGLDSANVIFNVYSTEGIIEGEELNVWI